MSTKKDSGLSVENSIRYRLRLAREDLADVGVELRLADRPVVPDVRADVDVQNRALVPARLESVMDVAAQVDARALLPTEIIVLRSIDRLETRIPGREVSNRDDVASDLRGQRPANRPHVVVRIVVALQEHDLALDLREIEVRLVASGLRPTVLAVVHEVADMDEQIVWLAALIDPTDQSSIMLFHGLEWTVRPVNDPRILRALEVEVAGEESFHWMFMSWTNELESNQRLAVTLR